MSNKAIGEVDCPLCRSKKAKVSVSKAGLTVMTCHRCNAQLFTRSDVSDGALRGLMRPMAVSDPDPEKETAGEAATATAAAKESATDKPKWLQW
jgi:hypothetical protein